MSTRARVGVLNADWSIRSIYTHWDGYPEHHYPILRDYYTDPSKINALLRLGSLSSLGAEIGTKTDFEKPAKGQCVAYMRDRGEDQGKSTFSRNPAAFEALCVDCWAEYAYLWSGTEWVAHSVNTFRPGAPIITRIQP